MRVHVLTPVSAFKAHRYYGHHGRRHAVLGTQGRQTDEVGSAQAEDGRASTSRRLHSCAKSTCRTASARSAGAALQQPGSSQMSISRSQRLQTRRLSSPGQQQGSRSTVPSPTSKQTLRKATAQCPSPQGRTPVQSPVQERVTAVLASITAMLVRFSLDTSYLQARRHAGTRAATSRGSETC